jgi:hypothetical protein
METENTGKPSTPGKTPRIRVVGALPLSHPIFSAPTVIGSLVVSTRLTKGSAVNAKPPSPEPQEAPPQGVSIQP